MSDDIPEPICMECGKVCYVTEIVDVGHGGPYELWNYCKKCDVETFHELPESMRENGY